MAEPITYSFDQPVSAQDLQPLFAQTNWAAGRSSDGIEAMLRNTLVYLGAWSDEKLIGFARVFGDGVYRCVIDDVVVEREFRGRGIGTELVRRLMQRVKTVDEVFLGCAEEIVPFYEKLGFRRATNPRMKWAGREKGGTRTDSEQGT